MEVQVPNASQVVDSFEELMRENGISIPQNPQSGADMLSFWHLLKKVASGFSGTADEVRPQFTAAVASHDLAAKVLEVSQAPDFSQLLPHLELLNKGAVHLTAEPAGNADTYNKLIELYWACLCMSLGRRVQLDHPQHATGTNPDVIVLDDAGNPARAYAFKTIRSMHTESVYQHVLKGVDQIERSPAREGVVALHMTPRIAQASLWPTGGYYTDWRPVAREVADELRKPLSAVINDNGQSEIDAKFEGKKAVGHVLCLAFVPIVAKHPKSDSAVVMPLKVAVLVDMLTGSKMSDELLVEVTLANDRMQTALGI